MMLLATLATTLALTVIDGDTVVADGVHYRIEAMDAPETGARAHCLAERRLGALAKAHAETLVASARTIDIEPHGLDRYGRTLARLRIDGADFASAMIDAGYAQPWPRVEPWCGR